jgi:hypothetical protein
MVNFFLAAIAEEGVMYAIVKKKKTSIISLRLNILQCLSQALQSMSMRTVLQIHKRRSLMAYFYLVHE